MTEQKYVNLILSTNPCPKCLEAAEREPMTEAEWRASEWGLPGSSGRYCEDDCHCLLVEAEAEVPEEIIGHEKLRGEDGSDITKIIEIGPKEMTLRQVIDAWHESGRGTLPKEVHLMTPDKAISYLRDLMGGELGG